MDLRVFSHLAYVIQEARSKGFFHQDRPAIRQSWAKDGRYGTFVGVLVGELFG